MSQMKSCIIVLKPTSFFSSFVTEQLPDFDCPSDDDLVADYTAYTLPVCENDEALLDHLERLFQFMFRHEVSRRLGEQLAEEIKADFLDFLCCFKFEVYSQSVLMASSLQDCQQLVCVKPRCVDVEWLPEPSSDQIEVRSLLDALHTPEPDQTASLLVRKFDKLSDLKPLVQRYCRPLLQQDLKKKAAQLIQWSTTSSTQMFHRYFAVEVHTQLVHLH